MHAGSIINEELISLDPGDTLEKALRAMDEFKVEHLPVAADGRYLGLVAEQHLLDKEGENRFFDQCSVDASDGGTGATFSRSCGCALRGRCQRGPCCKGWAARGLHGPSASLACISSQFDTVQRRQHSHP